VLTSQVCVCVLSHIAACSVIPGERRASGFFECGGDETDSSLLRSYFPQGYMDIASLSDLATTTGGTLYQYTPFNPALDHDQVLNDLKWNLVRPQGSEAVMRVRCSQGLEVESYLGAFCRQPANPTDVYLPAIDSDKAILANVGSREGRVGQGLECATLIINIYVRVGSRRQ